MIIPVDPSDIGQIAWVDPLKDSNVDAILGRIRPMAVVGVNPANPTEPMLCRLTAPLIQGQVFRALNNFHIPQKG